MPPLSNESGLALLSGEATWYVVRGLPSIREITVRIPFNTGISALQIRCFRRFVPRPARQAQASSEACHVRDDLFSAPVLVEAAYAVRSPKHVRHPPDQVCLDIGPRFVY